jgi:cobalt-zinc-cadmium efflux system outer membrane protein
MLLLSAGCLWPVGERVDEAVSGLAAHPFDVDPALPPEPPAEKSAEPRDKEQEPGKEKKKLELDIPPQIPGSEAKRIELPEDRAAWPAAIARLYPALPPLPEEPKPLPGPHGEAYTLAQLQHLAALNSPTLRQAASDVEAALGNVIQARAYPNPTMGYLVQPSNNNDTASVLGLSIDQVIKTGGKLKLAAAAAEMDLKNAELALKRARSDLATAVRNAYFALLVARETMTVNRALARFTDEIYRLQAELLAGGLFFAPYEPAALRAQAYTARLAYQQAIQGYIYAWKQLVATLNVRQLPLTEVAGRIDRLIPDYDYDAVLAHALRQHTDVLTARNGVEKARYNLKLAQVTPLPDVEVNVGVLKDLADAPFGTFHTATVSGSIPIWDQNKGAIIAAQGALARASEEPHRVEMTITNNLATVYNNYKANLAALEYYRRNILPDQVRFYRGVYARRRIDQTAAFSDLIAAQQGLATAVTTYLANLGSLWTAVVGVADFLQTDDLFQVGGQVRELPELPDLEHLPPWTCPHCGSPRASAAPADKW